MITDNDIIKMIFGFKVKYLRQQKNLSYQQLSEATGLSTSYLHDIEKGRKYPKVDKITALGTALDVTYDFLVSTRANKKLQPIVDLLTSDFIKEFPLEFFGISPEKLFELFSNTPDKVNAFISTIFKITRNYQLQRENLYMAALRSYQDMHDNYFESLEEAVKTFATTHKLKKTRPYQPEYLEKLLEKLYAIKVDRTLLPTVEPLSRKRCYYSEERKTLFLNQRLTSAQENFLLGRELAFHYLELNPRPYVTRISEADSFDKLLNNFKASYFSAALLMDGDQLADDIRKLATATEWQPEQFLSLLKKYDTTPEMLMQRITNILPHHFGIKDLFFIRLTGEENLQHFRMTKELHLSQLHNPYANEANEHYCRRWVSVNILKNLRAQQQVKGEHSLLVDAQLSAYWQTEREYLCISIAKSDAYTPDIPVSVTIGLMVTDELRRLFRFLDAPNITSREVHTTCERCGILDCEARAVLPVVIQARNKKERERQAMQDIDSGLTS